MLCHAQVQAAQGKGRFPAGLGKDSRESTGNIGVGKSWELEADVKGGTELT